MKCKVVEKRIEEWYVLIQIKCVPVPLWFELTNEFFFLKNFISLFLLFTNDMYHGYTRVHTHVQNSLLDFQKQRKNYIIIEREYSEKLQAVELVSNTIEERERFYQIKEERLAKKIQENKITTAHIELLTLELNVKKQDMIAKWEDMCGKERDLNYIQVRYCCYLLLLPSYIVIIVHV